jgi:putative membrane protein (TIGR04086 family)
MNTKSKLIAIIIGALVTLTLGAVALAALFHYYYGNVPLLPAVLAPFLCSLIGGYLATRLAQVRELTTGALSGLVAGLVMLLIAAVASSLASNTTLAVVLLILVWTVGGALGGWLTRVRLSLELA